MSGNNIAIEIKSDLERIYKLTGDLLYDMEMGGFCGTMGCNGIISGEVFDKVKFFLMDTAAILQKDIFNCDFIISGNVIQDAEKRLLEK